MRSATRGSPHHSALRAVICPHPLRKRRRRLDRTAYRKRHLVEVFFHKLKRFRALATRFDETAVSFQGASELACAAIWLLELLPPCRALAAMESAAVIPDLRALASQKISLPPAGQQPPRSPSECFSARALRLAGLCLGLSCIGARAPTRLPRATVPLKTHPLRARVRLQRRLERDLLPVRYPTPSPTQQWLGGTRRTRVPRSLIFRSNQPDCCSGRWRGWCRSGCTPSGARGCRRCSSPCRCRPRRRCRRRRVCGSGRGDAALVWLGRCPGRGRQSSGTGGSSPESPRSSLAPRVRAWPSRCRSPW